MANYLIPTQADPQIKADLDDQCLNMDYVMQAIEQAGNALNIFVLDACRNNPFRSFSRSSEKGLSMVNTPKGSYIVYATKPGSVASDGTSRNGLFTSMLLKYINTEGLNIEQVFKRVAADVATASNDSQRPWIASDYTGDFFFTPGKEDSLTNTNTLRRVVSQPEAKSAVVTYSMLDYGYGTPDAPTVTVGSQEWITKNLNVSKFANGDAIPEAKTDKEWKKAGKEQKPAWCYYNNEPSNGLIFGKLYNWYAVNDPRGLAPKGWHIPSDSEWTSLTGYLGGESSAGLKMKSVSGWNNNGNGNNNSGIAGLPGGNRWGDGTFHGVGKGGGWWSSSEGGAGKAWSRFVDYGSDGVSRNDFGYKENGFSVRCLRD